VATCVASGVVVVVALPVAIEVDEGVGVAVDD